MGQCRILSRAFKVKGCGDSILGDKILAGLAGQYCVLLNLIMRLLVYKPLVRLL